MKKEFENKELNKKGIRYLLNKEIKKKYLRILSVLGGIVVFCTTYALILPAITLEVEHAELPAHEVGCSCGMDEHIHSEDCYFEDGTLRCTIPEHIHDESCYPEDRIPATPSEYKANHEVSFPSDTSFATDSNAHRMIGESEEVAELATDSVAHRNAGDHEELLEPEELLAELGVSGEWPAALLEAAESQIGYTESRTDYEVTDEGSMKGYTRYGAWYGLPYEDWCAMFVSYCIRAAGQEEYPVDCLSERYMDVLMEEGYFHSSERYAEITEEDVIETAEDDIEIEVAEENREQSEESAEDDTDTLLAEEFPDGEPDDSDEAEPAGPYEPKPGDLVFFDTEAEDKVVVYDNDDVRADDDPDRIHFEILEDLVANHVGIVSDVSEKKIRTIEGNISDAVATRSYNRKDITILGYAEVPAPVEEEETEETEDPEAADSEMLPAQEAVFEGEAVLSNGMTVKVTAPQSSLPVDISEITLSAELLNDDELKQFAQNRIAEEGENFADVVLMDIRLLYNGEEIEPTGPVNVSFGMEENHDSEEVYHINADQDSVEAMGAEKTEESGNLNFSTDHFSIYAYAYTTDNAEISKAAGLNFQTDWDGEKITGFTVYFTNSAKDKQRFILQSSTEGPLQTSQEIEKGNDSSLSTVYSGGVSNPVPKWEIKGAKAGVIASFTIYDLLEAVSEGFIDWLNGQEDLTLSTVSDIYGKFIEYTSLPRVIKDETVTDHIQLTVFPENYQTGYTYCWKYQDENGEWQPLYDKEDAADPHTALTTVSINANNCPALLDGGAYVTCFLSKEGSETEEAISLFVNPLQEQYDAAVAAINEGLGLKTWPLVTKDDKGQTTTKEFDISIGGERFNNYFYYKHVFEDPDVNLPYVDVGPNSPNKNAENAEVFKNYLAKAYVDAGSGETGLQEVKKIWDRYVYDIYDPTKDLGLMTNITTYPAYTYGDQNPDFVKDNNSSSFHGTGTAAPVINKLDYDFTENGVDYSNFVSALQKTSTAVKAGDENTERKYLVDLKADAQAKAKAPVAMVLQIQTAWQLFDLMHANAQEGDGETEVGSTGVNTELANLYAIKKALLKFVDYMEEKYPGNNLVLGITETRHDASTSAMLGTDSAGKTLYVSNDYDVLRESIRQWDSFGNCEHVHYDSKTLEAAVSNLKSNLSGWQDFYGYPINYEDIQKVAVVIGGPTENSKSTNGYACTLPWDTFSSKGIDSVYGIRVNEGNPVAEGVPISWLDYSANNTGAPYNGTGNNFTKKYIATTWEAVYNTLIEIANREMNAKGLDVTAEDKYVEHVIVNDIVCDEFELDLTKSITAQISNKDGSVQGTTEIQLYKNDATNSYNLDSVTYNGNNVSNATIKTEGSIINVEFSVSENVIYLMDGQPITVTVQNDHILTITENADGTTKVSYDFGKVYNTKKADLLFGIVAKEDYLGSNNVFTNVGTPDLSYQHDTTDEDENPKTDTYERECTDTPEVNVPVRFETVNGDTKYVWAGENEKTNLAELGSKKIIADLINKLENYDQTNGTVQFTWTLPDGTVKKVDYEIPVKEGKASESIDFDVLESKLKEELNTPYEGTYPAKLSVSFVPDAMNASENFHNDAKTRTPVYELKKSGDVKVIAINLEKKQTVKKVWVPKAPADCTGISFILKTTDGETQKYVGEGVDEDGLYKLVDDESDAKEFFIPRDDNSNEWIKTVTGLRGAEEPDASGNIKTYEYAVEEKNVPSGYTETYDDEEVTGYKIKVTISVKPENKIVKNSEITVNYTLGGKVFTFTEKVDSDIAGNKTKTFDSYYPDGADSTAVSNIEVYVNNEKKDKVTATITAIKEEDLSKNTTALVIKNTAPFDPIIEPDPLADAITLNKQAVPAVDENGKLIGENYFDITLSVRVDAEAVFFKNMSFLSVEKKWKKPKYDKDNNIIGYDEDGDAITNKVNAGSIFDSIQTNSAKFVMPDGLGLSLESFSGSNKSQEITFKYLIDGNVKENTVTLYWENKKDVLLVYQMADHKYFYLGQMPGDGKKVTVDLTGNEAANTAFAGEIQKYLVTLKDVKDQMGDFIEYVSDSTITGEPTGNCAAFTDGILTWDKIVLDSNESAALTYRVRLMTEKNKFASSAQHMSDEFVSKFNQDYFYETNDHATLTYYTDTSTEHTLDFPKPYVRGLLYDIKLRKYDSRTNLPLEGVQFKIEALDNNNVVINNSAALTRRDSNGSYIVSTNGDGIAIFEDLVGKSGIGDVFTGKFKITEIKPPEGYSGVEAQTVEIKNFTENQGEFVAHGDNMIWEGHGSDEFILYNTPYPKIKLTKLDAGTGKGLSGAVFKLVKMLDEDVQDDEFEERIFESDENGLITPPEFKLPTGTYHLTETKAPDGYELLSKPVVITITDEGVVRINGPMTTQLQADTVNNLYEAIIRNSTGVELPRTGGRGMEILYAIVIAVLAGGLTAKLLLMTGERKKKQRILRSVRERQGLRK